MEKEGFNTPTKSGHVPNTEFTEGIGRRFLFGGFGGERFNDGDIGKQLGWEVVACL